MSQQTPPQYSPDGRYWWNGTEWVAVPNAGTTSPVPAGVVTPERRLEAEVQSYVSRGFRVVSQTPTTAQLVKPKKFSFVWAFLWFLVAVVGLIVYLLYYASKRDEQVFLSVSADGRITRR